MELTNRWDERLKEIEGIAGERRSDRRYDLKLGLRWKLLRRRKLIDAGTGISVDLSSGGIFFDAGHPLPVGLSVEISVAWPVMLQSTAPLQLVICGRIVRSSGTNAAIRTTKHEFRTVAHTAEQRVAASTRGVATSPALMAGGAPSWEPCRY